MDGGGENSLARRGGGSLLMAWFEQQND